MSSTFTVGTASELENIDANSKLRLHKYFSMLGILKGKTNNAELTSQQIGQGMGISDFPIERYKTDIKMDSLDNKSNLKKNKELSRTSSTSSNMQSGSVKNETDINIKKYCCSWTAAIREFYDVGLFEKFAKEDEFYKDIFTFTKIRRTELEINKEQQSSFLEKSNRFDIKSEKSQGKKRKKN